MRAALIEGLGAPPRVAELPVPERRPGEALVRMHAAALNPVELHIWHGRFFDGPPRPPYVPGVEGIGTVVKGDRIAPGTRVRVEVVHPGYGRDGALAEYVTVPEEPDSRDRASQAWVAPVPPGLDDVRAAALGVSGHTALQVLRRAEALRSLAGAHVLVLGATGAIGQVLVQVARLLGAARVVAAGRDPERLRRAVELGADAGVPLTDDGDAAEQVDRLREAGGGRLDVALDPLWGAPAQVALSALTAGGVLVNFGQAAGPTASLGALPLRNLGVSVIGYSGAWATPQQRRAALEEVHRLATEHGLTVDCEEVPLRDIASAWERQDGSPGRKLVVRLAEAERASEPAPPERPGARG